MIEIYTDGACKGNPGPGGWAAVFANASSPYSISGNDPKTTNQRMEVIAAIKALERVPLGTEATIYSDSRYLVETMNSGWKRNANTDLWPQLDGLVSRRKVSFRWVRGHADNALNVEADRQATYMADLAAKGEIVKERENAFTASNQLTHVDEAGAAKMVDVSAKGDTEREAIAKGSIVMKPETLKLIQEKGIEKGDVLAVALVAGIMAAKRTSDLIPMCHPLMLTHVQVDFEPDHKSGTIQITATVRTTGKTGVEMEALTAVTVAALTIYDMAKAVDRAMRIEKVRLVRKSGGKSGLIELE